MEQSTGFPLFFVGLCKKHTSYGRPAEILNFESLEEYLGD